MQFYCSLNNQMDSQNKESLFTILHFNDVYDIQSNKKGRFGVVSFEANLRRLKAKYPKHLILFSGDAFSPSILTNIFQGRQMIKALNKLGIDVACFGNHQFDLDSDVTEKLILSSNFPWLLGNIKYRGTQFLLGNGKAYLVKQYFGKKIGFFGIAGEDWLGILSDQYEGLLEYIDVGQHSRKMCKILKQQQQCQMIVALTHMRVPQDMKLPLQCPEIDIVLGGHDHIILKEFVNGIPVLKSGDNFKSIGVINVYSKSKNFNTDFKGSRYDFDIVVEEVPTITEGIDEQLKKHVQTCMQKYAKSDHVVGFTDVALDTRFSFIRTKQTNYGNFIADIIRAYFDCDCCLVNAGSIRNDLLIPPGQLRYSIISNLINGVNVVKEVPGSVLLQALEYGVSNLPGIFSGNFLCVSGIKLTYDTRKTPKIQQVWVMNQHLNPDKVYTVALPLYISMGGDGYEMLKSCKVVIDPIAGIDTLRLILKFFKSVRNIGQSHTKKKNIEQTPAENHNNNDDNDNFDSYPIELLKLSRKVSSRINRLSMIRKKFIIDNYGQKFVCISPKVDGRIKSLYP